MAANFNFNGAGRVGSRGVTQPRDAKIRGNESEIDYTYLKGRYP